MLSFCFYNKAQNNSFDIDVELISFAACTQFINISELICLGLGMAYSSSPLNWTGLFATAVFLPDIDILPGLDPIPLPSFDIYGPSQHRVLQFLPLTIGLVIAGGTAMGLDWVGMSVKLSQQLVDDMNMVYGSVKYLQDQVDSLAEVVLQNR